MQRKEIGVEEKKVLPCAKLSSHSSPLTLQGTAKLARNIEACSATQMSINYL